MAHSLLFLGLVDAIQIYTFQQENRYLEIIFLSSISSTPSIK
jgi:hypothetical protein